MDNKTENKNAIIYYFQKVAFVLANALSVGPIIQSFLAEIGLTEIKIGLFISCTNIVQCFIIFFSMFFIDNIKNIKKSIVCCYIFMNLFFVAMMMLAYINTNISFEMIFTISILSCIIHNVVMGIYNIVSYKLPYLIFNLENYTKYEMTSGIISNILSVLISILVVFLTGAYKYTDVIFICFLLCIISLLLSSWSATRYSIKENYIMPTTNSEKNFFKLLNLKETKIFIIPNLLRGIAIGIIAMSSVVMISNITTDKNATSALLIVSALATIISCNIFRKFCRKYSLSSFILFGGLIVLIGMSTLMIYKNLFYFYIIYFIIYFGTTFVDYGIPVYLTNIIPYNYIGGYTSIRMLLTTFGSSIGSIIAGYMSNDNPFLLFVIGGVFQIITCFYYYIYDKKNKNL